MSILSKQSMTLDFGLEKGMGLTNGASEVCKKRWRWLFKIPGVCSDGANTLPPKTSARPDLKWKEMSIQHVSETVYFPAKPDWSLLQITLYDLKKDVHPVFNWLSQMYMPKEGIMDVPNNSSSSTSEDGFIIHHCDLALYDGCGKVVERWVFEDAWPQAINFQTLDMSANEIVTCDITLRYARAYIEE